MRSRGGPRRARGEQRPRRSRRSRAARRAPAAARRARGAGARCGAGAPREPPPREHRRDRTRVRRDDAPTDPGERSSSSANGSARGAVREPGEVGERQRGELGDGRARATGASWPSAPAIVPSHMTGATAGAASTLTGSDTSDRRSKCSAISGAVPSVAAAVTASASASPRGTRRRRRRALSAGTSASIASTAAKLSCQPGSSAARGLAASVTAAASSSAYQRDAGRPASAATRPATPMTPARWIDGPAPASGT